MLTFEERVLCGNPLQRSGSGSEPDPEPNRAFRPVANTTEATQIAQSTTIVVITVPKLLTRII